MDLKTFQALLQTEGQAALADAEALEPTRLSLLRCLATLQKRYRPDLAKAALETACLRQQARQKFPTWWKRLYATREALEQASGEKIALYRASRYTGYPMVADLTCGLGADALALAMTGRFVEAIDQDPLRVALTQANAAAWNMDSRVRAKLADCLSWSQRASESVALWIDPDRRRNHQRHLHPDDYQPPLSVLMSRWGTSRPWGIKLAPGLPLSAVEAYRSEAEIEFIAAGGELKECVLWFGPLRSCERRATLVLPDPEVAHTPVADARETEAPKPPRPLIASLSASGPLPSPVYGPLANYVYHPSPAVVRAGLLDLLRERLGAARLHPRTTLLTADRPVTTPFADTYQVLERLPADLRHLRRTLKQSAFTSVTVVQCGSPLDAALWDKHCQQILRSFRLSVATSEGVFLLLTEDTQKPCLLIARKVLESPFPQPNF
ncbi:MAG: trimethylguanosine synthase [Gemmataceae bacterium]|jgi:hypothetical protein|uniref:THUMP-like domain-containing protein n=1 Tax=Thermogemmata fonticola TaxID=2755323 RepID=A0A7V8VBS3_9BACT|nr:class I SAM-dependent methyltransferase [Thermogemmata fonticola]MBA2225133.1 hypothetical protein [Thermogemmata fonticola]MCX8140554.1 trimethylguanosine synthase [Gemmataceae bacterium]GIW84410.1 MAG: hypothetical protein KatS3mg107_0070 [Gemmataceae bacterium]